MYNRSLYELLKIVELNISTGNYTPFNKMESTKLRDHYKYAFDKNINLPYENYAGDIIDHITNIKIGNGYERLVIGDYGAYLELSFLQIEFNNLYIKNGQEWRLNKKKYPSCKYYWYVTDNAENAIKIYYQTNTVKYADYKVGFYYVSPYEIKFNKEI